MKANEISHNVVPGFYERFERAYIDQLQNFVDNILGDRPPVITADDGIKALLIALAATISLHENRPVELSELK